MLVPDCAAVTACCRLFAVSWAPLKSALKCLVVPTDDIMESSVLMFTACAVLTAILVLLPDAFTACCRLLEVN